MLKPIAFRIRDFRSIKDSGECKLSGDGVTVLAGQNEAGKTAILTALRDFDLEEGHPPLTQEYLPEDGFDANPTVSVKFAVEIDDLVERLKEDDAELPLGLIDKVRKEKTIWITREMRTGKFTMPPDFRKHWQGYDTEDQESVEASENDTSTNLAEGALSEDSSLEEQSGEETEVALSKSNSTKLILFENLGRELRVFWPVFIYFDSFGDTLPKEVEVESLYEKEANESNSVSAVADTSTNASTVSATSTNTASTTTTPSSSQATKKLQKKVPQSVLDFITLSGMNISLLKTYTSQEKMLGNYLQKCGAAITGDFLTYWKQKVDGRETVNLQVRHHRGEEGKPKLAFYVRDKVDQYPEQRSKGFLWFLSFYLRLAAAEARDDRTKRLLVVDEPGSYLHARAQQDVLHLFEDRIAKTQQVIYSTHSVHLLPSTNLHRLRIVIKKTEKGTVILDKLTHPDLRGAGHSDTLSPIIESIGLDVRNGLKIAGDNNLLVEGISDRLYLQAWAKATHPEFLNEYNVVPGTGAFSLITLASLLIGWGIPFKVLLDRDDQGNAVKEKLISELLVNESQIIQPRNAQTIEDIFSAEDFQMLLNAYDNSLNINQSERPSVLIKRLNLDKVLVARLFSEKSYAGDIQLSEITSSNIQHLLEEIRPKPSSRTAPKKK